MHMRLSSRGMVIIGEVSNTPNQPEFIGINNRATPSAFENTGLKEMGVKNSYSPSKSPVKPDDIEAGGIGYGEFDRED